MKQAKFEIILPAGSITIEVDNEERTVTRSINGTLLEVITAQSDGEWKTFIGHLEKLISGVTLE